MLLFKRTKRDEKAEDVIPQSALENMQQENDQL